jgi:hypothetical protein
LQVEAIEGSLDIGFLTGWHTVKGEDDCWSIGALTHVGLYIRSVELEPWFKVVVRVPK